MASSGNIVSPTRLAGREQAMVRVLSVDDGLEL
jgi:hypothetical protein